MEPSNRLLCPLLTLAGIILLMQTPIHGNEPSDRAAWQKPDSVLALLNVAPGQVVADIGAGEGYFSIPFAKAVLPGGRVLAVDTNPDRLKAAAERAAGEGLASLDTVRALPDDPQLPPASVDLIFICNALHHIDNRAAYYPRLIRSLKPGGRFAVIDFYEKDLPVGPRGPEHKLAKSAAMSELLAAGFEIVDDFALLPYQYFLVARVSREHSKP